MDDSSMLKQISVNYFQFIYFIDLDVAPIYLIRGVFMLLALIEE